MIIRHLITREIMFDGDVSGLSGADCRGADCRGADMREADMSGANLRGADLRGANLRGADMSDADFRWADFRGSDFRGADMSGSDFRGANVIDADMRYADMRNCIGNGREIRTMQTPYWPVVFYRDLIAIGCEYHTVEEWTKFKDSRIKLMDEDALEFWSKYRQVILTLATMDWREE